MWKAGPTNSLADIASVRVGHAQDDAAKTGTSVMVFDEPATASVSIVGQAPGTRECALLDPSRTVDRIDGLVLSGGSAFGLSAADPVLQGLADQGRGFAVGDWTIPIVPAAILFDLTNGGEKPRNLTALYRTLGAQAFANIGHTSDVGQIGAGTGATTGAGQGGLGTASIVFAEDAPTDLRGKTLAAMVAVNAVGSVQTSAPRTLKLKTQTQPGQNTTIGCIVTDIALDKRACHQVAIAGQDGIASAIFPAHTALDGDLVFAASTSAEAPLADPRLMTIIQAAANATMAAAIIRTTC